jgi:hypothetical protein
LTTTSKGLGAVGSGRAAALGALAAPPGAAAVFVGAVGSPVAALPLAVVPGTVAQADRNATAAATGASRLRK